MLLLMDTGITIHRKDERVISQNVRDLFECPNDISAYFLFTLHPWYISADD